MSLYNHLKNALNYNNLYEGFESAETFDPAHGWTTSYYPEAVKE